MVQAGGTAKIRVTLDGALQAPLRAAAALGSVGRFVRTGPNTLEADFAPPALAGPAQVLVAVFEDRSGGALRPALVDVAGPVEARVRVDLRDPIYVRAGEIRSGPFHPVRGEVALRFVASGRLQQAQVETAAGRALASVPIHPILARTLAIARPAELRQGSRAPAEALLVAPFDGAFRFEPPRATAGAGRLALDLESSPEGCVRFAFTPPAAAMGVAAIPVRMTDALGRVVGAASFGLAGARVAAIRVALPSQPLAAGDLVQIAISLSDEEGHPADGELALQIDAGELAAPLRLAPGSYRAAFTAPQRVPSDGVVRLTARTLPGEAGPPASARVEIPVRGGPPARVVFGGLPKAQAGQTVEVRFQVLDRLGNPADPRALQLVADRGEVAPPARGEDGSWTAAYRAPEQAAESATLGARDGDASLEGNAELAIEPAQAGSFALVGPLAGFTSNLGEVSAASLGATGFVRLTSLLALGAFVGYLPAGAQVLSSKGAAPSATLRLSRLPLHARAGLLHALGPFNVFGGLEAGPTRTSGTLTAPGYAPLDLGAWRFEYGLYAGGGYRLGPGYLSAEIRGTQARLDQATPDGLLHLSGSVGGVEGAVGYLFPL